MCSIVEAVVSGGNGVDRREVDCVIVVVVIGESGIMSGER